METSVGEIENDYVRKLNGLPTKIFSTKKRGDRDNFSDEGRAVSKTIPLKQHSIVSKRPLTMLKNLMKSYLTN